MAVDLTVLGVFAEAPGLAPEYKLSPEYTEFRYSLYFIVDMWFVDFLKVVKDKIMSVGLSWSLFGLLCGTVLGTW